MLMSMVPEAGIARWAERLEALAVFSKVLAVKHRTGRAPEKTYAVGLSNGGYAARRAAESPSEISTASSPALGLAAG